MENLLIVWLSSVHMSNAIDAPCDVQLNDISCEEVDEE